jgi:hypothetical protein
LTLSVKGAVGFVGEGVERGGEEGASAGEQEKAGFGTEEVIEGGCGEAEIGLAFGSEGMCPDVEEGVLLGLEGTLAECFVGEDFESALEDGGGDVGGLTEVLRSLSRCLTGQR